MTRKLEPKIIPQLLALTPMEMYRLQVRNNTDSIRYTARNIAYSPTQFGGIAGQRILLSEPSVMEVIDFEVT